MLSDKFSPFTFLSVIFFAGFWGFQQLPHPRHIPRVSETPHSVVPDDSLNRVRKTFLLRHTVLRPGRISQYDRLIKKYSFRYGFDWRLIAAQIHAESRFNARAKSRSGALGLMQILPSTAKHLGKSPHLLLKPEINIALGCLYDRRLYTIWKEEKGTDRLAFMLASYNAGHRRVMRAQKRARQPDKWGSIKRHLPGQTRHYVFKIFKTYALYKRLVF